MHDVAWAEGAGLPAVALFWRVFQPPQAAYIARCLGQSRLARVAVPHPTQDNTAEEVTAKAEAAYAAIALALTTDGGHFPAEAEKPEPRRAAAAAEAGCAG
jgi:hypothetical protein